MDILNEVNWLMYFAGVTNNLTNVLLLISIVSFCLYFVVFLDKKDFDSFYRNWSDEELNDNRKYTEGKIEKDNQLKLAKYFTIIPLLFVILLPDKTVLYSIALEKLTNVIQIEKKTDPKLDKVIILITKKIQSNIKN